MSLPALTFYRMPDAVPAAATIAGLLDAIYAAGASATDYRGTSLASTHLWTWAQQAGPVATYATPPAGTPMAKSPGIIFAGSSGSPTPTMLAPDSFSASSLLLGISHSVVAWGAWEDAAPFGGVFSGYSRAAGTTWNSTSATVRVFVSQEQIFVQLIGATVTQQAWLLAGASVEPHANYADSAGADCESDDRLYGMMSTGATGVMTASWLVTLGNTTPFNHSTTANNGHMYVFQPGSSSMYPCGRKTTFGSASTVTEVTTPSGVYVGDAMPICRSSASNQNGGQRLGVLRAIYPTGQVQSGRVLRDGSTDLYHVVSCDTTANSDGMFLTAAA